MNSFEEFLIEFEKYIDKKFLKLKKYELENSFVFDIEEEVVLLVEQKEEFSKNHFIVKEILNAKNENNYHYSDINIKPFCAKYTKEWVTYRPFSGEVTEDFEKVDKSIPELQLSKRYYEWEGYKIIFAGYQLIDNGRKGYALFKCKNISGINELRATGERILSDYLDYTMGKHASLIEQENVIQLKTGKSFIINREMAQILNERYINKYPIDYIKKVNKIPDLKGFWAVTYQKNKNEIPYKFIEELEKEKANDIIINDLYTASMKDMIPKIEDFNKEYYYVSVTYADRLSHWDSYSYLSDDNSIKTNDIVLVNRSGEDVVALVIDAKYYSGAEAPYPPSKTKSIIKKIESNEELNSYGYTREYFKDNYIDDDEDEDDYYDYYIVRTISDNEEIINTISKTLMEKKLVAGSQISKVKSDYWWEGKIVTKEEFKVEFRTRADKLNEITTVIECLHNYQVPEISATQLICLTDEIKKWIDESVGGD